MDREKVIDDKIEVSNQVKRARRRMIELQQVIAKEKEKHVYKPKLRGVDDTPKTFMSINKSLPKPRKDETCDDWMNRAMGEDELQKRYPDRSMRMNVATDLWNRRTGRR